MSSRGAQRRGELERELQEYWPARSKTPRLQHISLLRCEADRSEFGIHALSPRCSKPPVSRSASQPSVSLCVATARRTSLARLILLIKPTSNVFIHRGRHHR